MKRIFINSIPAVGLWSYEGPFVHYITHVLRGKPGDSFLWFDGHHTTAIAKLTSVHKHSLDFSVTENRSHPSSSTGTHLAMTVIKPQAMEWVIQKATELGCDALTPIISKRTQSHYGQPLFFHSAATASSAARLAAVLVPP